MNIAARIQALRKTSGLSQEELADRIGVSRQAVSKWESEQSLPDLEKIILLSEFFGTTTDYLLKGIVPEPTEEPRRNAMLFAITGTVLNAAGLIAAVMLWLERQTVYAAGLGLILMLIGSGVFLAGQYLDRKNRRRAGKFFLLPNVWLLLFIPLSCCFNLADGLLGGFSGQIAPVPLLGNSVITFLLFWGIYIAVCVSLDIAVINANRTLDGRLDP